MRYYSHLSWTNRLKIERMLLDGRPVKEIANALHFHISTIYREKKRGLYMRKDGDTWEDKPAYSPDIAEQKYREHLKEKGADLKIGKDHKLANFIQDKIADEGYSPEAVIGEIKAKNLQFETSICTRTVYNYVDKGVFHKLTRANLTRGDRKQTHKKVKKAARAQKGDSIEFRPKEVEDRKEFGHWEMDTVVGKKGGSKALLLVMTERKTREEILMKLKDKTAQSVVEAINKLERKWGKRFRSIFKTITVDNGCEFSDPEGITNSVIRKGKRTKLFYCHPYSSYERGSNENNNLMVRRKFPKGTDFGDVTNRAVQAAQDWINNYPRKMFGFQSAHDRFMEELSLIMP